MKKKYVWLWILAPIGICLFYLWYAHASIYWKLGAVGLGAPSDMHNYTIGNASGVPLTYVALGDSLTSGVGVDSYTQSYPYLLAEKIAAASNTKVTLMPFAVPGVRTDYVLSNFIIPALASKPDIITLFIGINDIHGKVSNALFKAHYSEILSQLSQGSHAHIYVINLPYIGTPELISPLYRYYFAWRTQQYNAIIKDLADQYHVTYIDLYAAHKPHELNAMYYASDYFHQNALGYTLWTQSIYAGFNQ